jgi:hypothetical protein
VGKSGNWLLRAALAGGLLAGNESSAVAQPRHAVAMGAAQALSTPPAPELRRDDSTPQRDRTPIAPAGVGVKLGMAGMGAGKLTVSGGGDQSYTGRVDSRRGLHLAIPIHLGGSGFGFTLEPYLSRSSIGHTVKDASGLATGTEDAELTAYGVYFGPAVNIHVAQPLYLGVGVGVKGAYVASDDFDLALDAYGRVPLSATYYVTNQLAVVAELGLGYGVSIFADKPRPTYDASTGTVRNAKDDPRFGRAVTWDCTIGVRLP